MVVVADDGTGTEGQTEGQTDGKTDGKTDGGTSGKVSGMQTNDKGEQVVPYERFKAQLDRAKEAEKQATEAQQKLDSLDEEKEKEKGEWEKLANRRQTQLDAEKKAHAETKAEFARFRRMHVWQTAADGVIKPEAIEDAYSFIDEEEWNAIDDTDVNAVRSMAQTLAEQREYLADGPRGTGSGGSGRPVFAKAGAGGDQKGSKSGTQGQGGRAFQFKKNKQIGRAHV